MFSVLTPLFPHGSAGFLLRLTEFIRAPTRRCNKLSGQENKSTRQSPSGYYQKEKVGPEKP
jgi:hypothetical protein